MEEGCCDSAVVLRGGSLDWVLLIGWSVDDGCGEECCTFCSSGRGDASVYGEDIKKLDN